MIEIKPVPYNKFPCPKCLQEGPHVDEVEVWGISMLAKCSCNHCDSRFINTLPVSHAVEQCIAVDSVTNQIYNQKPHWFLDILIRSLGEVRNDDLKIVKMVYRECNEVVILNTIDFLYGHTLLKLFNAQHHLDRDRHLGLIVIVPKMFEWLVPEGCAEVWIINLPLQESRWRFRAIKDFVEKEMQRFDKVFLSHAYSHPDFSTIDIKRFTGVSAFNLDSFSTSVPTFTFVVREDRWWLESRFYYVLYRMFRGFRKLSYCSVILAKRQNALIKDVIRNIREVLPDAKFIIVGLGKSGSFQSYAEDHRATRIDKNCELAWCGIYAKSHAVIGIHGSNMLLPTALAAGCIEILPEDRYGNIIQDIAVRFSDRRSLFLYRFVPQYVKPRAVAKHLLSLIHDYERFYKSMCVHQYDNVDMIQTL